MADRCTGHCSRCFWFNATPEELREDHERWLAGGPNRFEDIDILGPMLIPVGDDFPREPLREDLPRPEPDPWIRGHFYRCRYQLPNGDCGIYEIRPRMCREYPSDGLCRLVDCTWNLAREGKAPRTRLRIELTPEQIEQVGGAVGEPAAAIDIRMEDVL
jgi:Fe-S-cluster containining protein